MNSPTAATQSPGLSPENLLTHWQGHRRLTRRTVEAFPAHELFDFAIGGMRPFGVMVLEIIGMAVPLVQGIASGAWDSASDRDRRTKDEVLQLWDESTEAIDALWPQIPAERFGGTLKANKWEMPVYDAILYAIDNEIHHRAQGFVYLRALEVEPPTFFER